MERIQVLVKAVVSTTRNVVSDMTMSSRSKSVFSTAEAVAKQLLVIEPEVLLFGVLKCFLGGTGGIGSAVIFILETIISLRPWKKD